MKKKIIIDCDPGIDDSIALMLALEHPDLEVLGITTVSGNVIASQGAKNALKVLRLLGREDIPVYIGEKDPLVRTLVTAQDTHGDDGLGETAYDTHPNMFAQESAVDFILQCLKDHPTDTITLVALGPMTNVAKAIKKNSSVFHRVKEILSMGGAYRIHGNCSPVAEFNYWVDPHAADYALKNISKPFYLFPLDVTRKIVLTPNLREVLLQMKNPKAQFMYDITRFYVDFHWVQERTLGCVINDPLVLAWLIDPSICTGFDSYVEVVEEGIALGQTMVDSGNFYGLKSNTHIMTQVNSHAFMDLLFKTLFPEFKEEIIPYI